MHYLKNYWLSITFVLISGLCVALYGTTPSYIDENGFLVEAFGFIPLSWFFLLLSAITFLVTYWRNKR
ncbi:hypothetical protein DA096_21630 [Vibrio rotiferianus]|uniref:DUF3955 domain-containing protein n=1 Tax=Vibrio rotiferianus TaxID=190895 RepID=UPI0011103D94|nr:DUF3955 domain-containing protein [Vibrio rotiferianus]TMX31129.1 hypothetical protein DA095_23875 [Vibrio rotiferianus]TMX43270.1 hypothetical protein DA093_24470 [Vibrio rotiferianus]TMX59814.1 hypothetical protein DA096_21630 [Vibrio rotiferianus]